jgi:hypothetical protein
MVGGRHLLVGKQKRSVLDIAVDCSTPYAGTIVKIEHGGEKCYTISFGFNKARLKYFSDDFTTWHNQNNRWSTANRSQS